MDVNKVWLSGIVFSDPVMEQSFTKTPCCSFLLQVKEHFVAQGKQRSRSSFVKIEALGRLAPVTLETVKKGTRHFVDGYIRQEDSRQVDQVKVRAFAIYKDQGADQELYSEALRQAIEVLKSSRDKEAALKTLEGLVAS